METKFREKSFAEDGTFVVLFFESGKIPFLNVKFMF